MNKLTDLEVALKLEEIEKEEETIEEVAANESEYLADWEDKDMYQKGFINGYKIGIAKRSYSDEELKSAFRIGFNIGYGSPVQELDLKNEYCERWFEQFKKK